ncbi:MAG: quinol monooxygenase YgiN [Saprospiraceae bacterium]|jgi:quinol monooxygenase YgiN
MPNQELTVIAKILAKPSNKELVQHELQKLVDETRAEEGCILYDLHQDNKNENLFLFYEKWKNHDLWQDHIKAKPLKRFRKATKGAIEEIVVSELVHIR